jgi:hypothetical protein
LLDKKKRIFVSLAAMNRGVVPRCLPNNGKAGYFEGWSRVEGISLAQVLQRVELVCAVALPFKQTPLQKFSNTSYHQEGLT